MKNAFLGGLVSRFVYKIHVVANIKYLIFDSASPLLSYTSCCSPTTIKTNLIWISLIYMASIFYQLVRFCNPMICRISVCEKYNFQAQIRIQIYKCLICLANKKKLKKIWLDFFWQIQIYLDPFHRKIQIQIYLGVPKLG